MVIYHEFIKEKNPANALRAINDYLKRDPENTDALFLKGDALTRLGRNAEALETADEGLKINANDADLMEVRIRALASFHRYEELPAIMTIQLANH